MLPAGLVYIDPASLRDGEVEITAEEPREPGNFIVNNGDAFEDVRQLGEPLPRDLGARRGAALPVSGVAEQKHLKKMTSPFPCRILSLRNLLLHST